MSVIVLTAGILACALGLSVAAIFLAMPEYPWQGEEGV